MNNTCSEKWTEFGFLKLKYLKDELTYRFGMFCLVHPIDTTPKLNDNYSLSHNTVPYKAVV
jgi:hypothetical protein